jgi:hypothetical protein
VKLLGEVICSRRLTRRDVNGGGDHTVVVRIGKPKKERRSWVCPFHISRLGSRKPFFAYGEDAVQALLMAFEGVRVTLKKNDSSFTWIGEEGDAGFPMLVDGGADLSFTRRLESLVEKEKDKFWKKAAAAGRRRAQRR